ncbi:MAG: histidine kinase [Ruminococcaceae bacterium]|nr:histidine kinase [Oscillospiraceae bacterium]
MKKRIFNSIFLASFITFFCCILLILGVAYPFFNNRLAREVEREAEYLAAGVELSGAEYMKSVDTPKRLTLISRDGTVLFDNQKKAEEMENHADREEIIEAFQSGSGESRRYSYTLTKHTLYYAKRLENDTVLRVSAELYSVGGVIAPLIFPMLAILSVATLLSLILASSLSKKIVKPINELDTEGVNVESPYAEISPLVRKVSRQNRLIELQMGDLKRRQEEFLTITENMSEGLILLDKNGDVITYNKAAMDFLDAGASFIMGSVLKFSDNEEFIRVVRSCVEGNNAEAEIKQSKKVYQVLANPVFVDEEVNGAVLLILDITEKSRRESMRREFTSNVSHELKTPLTSIYGISEMMMNGLVRTEDMQKFSENIHQESGRLITLISDIMKLSQLDENALDMSKETVDLYAVALSVADRLMPVAKKCGVSLSVVGEKAELWGIYSVITEMVYNLCDNAIKYNRPGGTVQLRVFNIDSHPVLFVEDTGIGIPKEDQDRVFERFYRVDKSHSSAVGGTGLGLSIVKHGASVHSARIGLESREGEGTKITVIF